MDYDKQESKHPTVLIQRGTVQLLKSLSICAGLYAEEAQCEAVKTLSGLLKTLVQHGCNKDQCQYHVKSIALST